MYEITETILKMFDIKKLKNTCNYPECEKKPDKEVYIYEYQIKKTTGIITLYLCKNHLNSADELIKKIKVIEPRLIVQKKENSMGQ